MGEQIINRDPDSPALLVRQTAGRTAALTVQQPQTTGGSAVNVVGDSTTSPAVSVRGGGDLLRLRDSSGRIVLSVGQDGVGLVPSAPTGSYYAPVSPHAVTTSAALGVGTLRVSPFILNRTVRLTRIAANVTVVGEAGSKFRMGIWADDGTCYPGALIVDAGQIAGDSATAQEATVDVTLVPGAYWIGGAVQSVTTTQPTLTTVSTSTVSPIPLRLSATLSAAASGTGVGLSTAGVTGAFDVTFPAGGGATFNVPRLLVRAV